MWCIIEGATCSGKTTLYDRVYQGLKDNAVQVHMERPAELTRRWVLKEYVNRWERHKDDAILADRWHWGEVSYAPIYRPETDLDGFGLLGRAGWRWTEMFLASRGAAIAHLTASNETLITRLRERGDDHVQNEHDLLRVSSLYEVARRESINVAAIHDTSPEETDEEKYSAFADSFVQAAHDRSESAQAIRRWGRYTGVPRPQTLLVGDRRNVTRRYGVETHLPFMPVAGNSADFLLNALPDMFWRVCGMVNGHEVQTLKQLVRRLGDPSVIALGQEATSALQAQGVEVTATVPHPMWVRRFHYARQLDYGQLIAEAAATGEVNVDWTSEREMS